MSVAKESRCTSPTGRKTAGPHAVLAPSGAGSAGRAATGSTDPTRERDLPGACPARVATDVEERH